MSKPFVWLQHALPQHALSRLAGRFAGSRRPWLRDRMIARFAATYGIDMSEAERPLGSYDSFNDFFTRSLKPGARPLADASQYVLSPADGAVSQLGRIEEGRIFQAKGHSFTATELLGGDEQTAARFTDGHFATIYLSPRDYHWVHMPVSGTLLETTYVPGELFSVNAVTAEGVPRLFARNERLACLFDSDLGQVASVMVGAMIVAGIETVWGGRVEPHGRKLTRSVYSREGAAPHRYEAGEEMGRFLLGSTVVLLFEENRIEFCEGLQAGSAVRMGQALAHKL
ncbi:archaetidylserine decarboxylase [Erythrobacter litoralis]|uniref:Phosphatidylserine decarboxylase proenzyme n=1 Tax=Erythrobacter litoralis (strain HTCC2594) TaxID=314225 RepID=Q2N752_ERYLH|nr:archaetidylserine decarboxylase [Erythrobacter litoralis]ABC64489.1 phosphatidylserine decarboxylase [Erythrobacter litoralis HTCC2594]